MREKTDGTKRYLKLLTAAGLVAVAAGGAGTFASFSAQTTNEGNTFKTGTLLLSDKVAEGTACFSNEAASNEAGEGCDAILESGEFAPGEGSSNYLTIKNVGTLDASEFKLWGSACTDKENEAAFEEGAAENKLETGSICEDLKFSLERDETANGEAESCLVGTAVGGGNEACDQEKGTSLKTWLQAHEGLESAEALGGLTAGASRFYKVYLYLPESAGNGDQGRIAEFDLTWHIDQ